MIQLPPVLYDVIGGVIVGYGVFHLIWSARKEGSERLSHRIRGVLFLVLGAWLIATGLGWRPFGGPKAAADPPRGPEVAASKVAIDHQPKACPPALQVYNYELSEPVARWHPTQRLRPLNAPGGQRVVAAPIRA
jgi:hypothetical protein